MPRFANTGAVVVCLAIGIWLVDLLGGFSGIDAWIYDNGLVWTAAANQQADRVVLIHGSKSSFQQDGNRQLIDLIQQLRQLNVRAIGLAFEPETVSPELRSQIDGREEASPVFLGRRVIRDRRDPSKLRYLDTGNPISQARDRRRLADDRWGVLHLPPGRRGVLRSQMSTLRMGDGQPPLFESVIASSLGSSPSNGRSYLIGFRGGPGSLPNLSIDNALSGGLIRELVRDRVVLIGTDANSEISGLCTPTTGEAKMSALEFHGQALNSLLNETTAHVAGAEIRLFFCLLAASFSLLVYQRANTILALSATIAMLILAAVLSLGLYFFAHLWTGLTAYVLVQLSASGVILRRRSLFANSMLNRLVLDLSAKLRKRRWPSSVLTSTEPWPQIVSFIQQTLDLNRLIILESPQHSCHLREVHAFKCGFADIREMRRDYRRWPYAAALEARKPLRLDASRPFLIEAESNEEQYLAPLLFGGELFGFLGLGVALEQLEASPDFELRLNDFAGQIAELLYHRRCNVAETERAGNWRSIVSRTPEADVYDQLAKATHLLDKRLTRLEHMFDTAGTALAVYDLFGRALMINDKMHRILEAEGTSGGDLTTVDLVSVLTNRDLDSARRVLRKVVAQKAEESLPSTLASHQGSFVLHVRALNLEQLQTQDSHGQFQLQGIVCELIDRSDLVKSFKMKEELTDKLAVALRNDLSAVDVAASLLAADGISAEDRATIGQMIHTKVGEAVATIEDCSRFMLSEFEDDHSLSLPMEPFPPLDRSVGNVAHLLEERGITVIQNRPRLCSNVLAAPEVLGEVFDAMLQFAMLDARDDSQLQISVSEDTDTVGVTISTDGFGVAGPSFESERRDRDGGAETLEYRALEDAQHHSDSWGGKLEVSSEIGSGASLKLVLRKF